MSSYTATFESIVTYSLNATTGLRTEAAATATVIITAPDQAAAMAELFAVARGHYLKSKTAKSKDGMKVMAAAWHNLTAALSYHFGLKDLQAKWPNIRSGDGECRLTSVAEAREAAKSEREQSAEREKAELAAFVAQQEEQKLSAWQSLTIDQQVAELLAMADKSLVPEQLKAALAKACKPTPKLAKAA